MLGTLWYFYVQGFFNCQRPGVFLIHWRDIIQPIKIGQRLKIGFIFYQFFCTAMQQPDMRVCPLYNLAIHFQNKAQHAMCGRMLGAKIQGQRTYLHFTHNLMLLPLHLRVAGQYRPAPLPMGW